MLSWMSWINKIPWGIVLAVIWAGLRLAGMTLDISSIQGGFMITLAFVAIVLEFNKSGDISLLRFSRDNTLAQIATIGTTIIATKLWLGGSGFAFPDLLVWFAILFDGVYSPINSFRTALRNVSANVGGPALE